MPVYKNIVEFLEFINISNEKFTLFEWKPERSFRRFDLDLNIIKENPINHIFFHRDKGNMKLVYIRKHNLIYTVGASPAVQYQLLEALLEYVDLKMDFCDYLGGIAGECGIEHVGLTSLAMPHGFYTGGKSQVSLTKDDLESGLKPATETNLDYYLTEAERVGLSTEGWKNLMQMAIGQIVVYEWECKRNSLEVDNSLRSYLGELVKLKPGT